MMRAETAAPRMGRQEWVMLLGLALLWSGSFFFTSVAARELPSFTIVWLRVTIAGVALLAVLRVSGVPLPRERRVWVALLILGVLNNAIPFALFVWAQHRIPSGLAAILNATTPLFSAVLAHVFTADEKLTPNKIVGVLIGLAGAAMMIGVSALEGVGDDLLPQLACLGASLSYGVASVHARRLRRIGVSPITAATGQVLTASLIMLPLTLVVDQPWTLSVPSARVWAAIIAIALLSTATAYILYFRIIQAAGATNAALVTLLVPPGAVLLGVIGLGERLLARHLVGMALIGLGLACIDGRLLARRRAERIRL